MIVRLALVVAVGMMAGCSSCSTKPSEKECREAIENIRTIRNTAQVDVGADPRKAVRSCQGQSSKKTVQCFIAAKSNADLAKCEGDTGEEYFEAEKKSREANEKKAKESDDKAAKEADDKAAQDEKAPQKDE